jgi:hypothetical protein
VDLFARKRDAARATERQRRLARAERRHPQAESLVAAVFADGFLFDGLRHRIREDVEDVDDYGRPIAGSVVAGRLFELDNVSALFVLLHLIAANGGRDVEVGQHGAVGDGLPLIAPSKLTQLRLNGLLTVRRHGSGFRVGPGWRVRYAAMSFGIDVRVSMLR